jgi:FkbM family methyltransferase
MKTVLRENIHFKVVDDTKNYFFWDLNNWEQENYKIIKELSNTHNVFVHAGGWIGPFTLFASYLYDKVYCLEPDPTAFEELERNIKLNNFSNIVYENKAFLNENKKIKMGTNFTLGDSGTNIFHEPNGFDVETITLNNFFIEKNIPKYSFLMLDVEGAEYLLLDDFEFFKNYKPTVLISYHLTFLTDENFDFLIKSLVKLKEIYHIDIEEFIEQRKNCKYGNNFKELNYLYKIKNDL